MSRVEVASQAKPDVEIGVLEQGACQGHLG
jgi:hypothetical protein